MAAFTPNVPPSVIIRSKGTGDDVGLRQTKEQYRRLKELEEARKAGTEPAQTDEGGRDINPHIPQFISQAPWYFGASGATLKHQRPHPDREKQLSAIGDWYKRGVTTKVATKYRKGACENCGAMTHKQKDCFERPRKLGARFTGEDIAPDEHLQPNLALDYDAKRDRWNGYNPAEHKAIIDEFQALEETRKLMKAERIKEGIEEEEKEKAEAEEEKQIEEKPEPKADEDEDKYAEDADMPGVKTDMDSRTRITVRNLRIREDTAKYLYNLDPNSAYYDPKSRSMRENPFAGTNKQSEAVKFSGENFVRYTGEVFEANKAQMFAWDAHRKGVDVHALAEPTKLEVLRRDLGDKKDSVKDDTKKALLDRYGGEEHLTTAPPELLLAQTENYVEYSRKGAIVKGEERQSLKSKYEEDVFHNNHTSVWGSFWRDGEWGYSCCHSVIKNSYCTGEAGIVATDKTPALPMAKEMLEAKEEAEVKSESSEEDSSSSSSSSSESEDQEEKASRRTAQKRKRRQRKKANAKRRKRADSSKGKSKSSSSSDEEKTEESKLKKAMKKAEKADREAEQLLKIEERSRPYNKNYEIKVPTEYDMEAFNRRKILPEDPMAQYMNEKLQK